MNRTTKQTKWNPTTYYQDGYVAATYDRSRFTSLPGRVFNFQEKRIILNCFRDLPRNTLILDVPCGTGRLAEVLLEADLNVHGADISSDMLNVAQERLGSFGERFTTEILDVFAIREQSPRFDAALCARVLMHFPLDKQIEFLRSVAALTKNRIVISHSLRSPYQRLRRGIKKLLGHQEPARYPVTNGEIAELLRQAGFREKRRKRLNPLISEAIYIVAVRK